MSQQDVASLQDELDMRFQRREWAAQRISWTIMLLIVAGALVGLFATGPLSSTSATTAGGSLSAEYGRFARHEAYTDITLSVTTAAVEEGEARIFADDAFLNTWTIDSFTPEPDSTELADGGIVWSFPADLATSGQITIRLQPERIGVRSGKIGLANGELVTIRQLIYP